MSKFMKEALKQAQKSYEEDEVPIGAVIVQNGKVLSRAHNTRNRTQNAINHSRNKTQNAINHAEILAISKACKKLGSWRLDDCEIYVTLEPCPMCAGAILNARIKKLYFGAYDKTSKTNILDVIMQDDRLNHKTLVEGGIMQDECSKLLTEFFVNKRNSKKS